MTITVTQSNLANFPTIPIVVATQTSVPPPKTTIPPVYEAWPIDTPVWTIDLTFTTNSQDAISDISVVSNPDNLFQYASVNFTKLTSNSMRVYGPALNVFRDPYYMFQLEYPAAKFKVVDGVTVEDDPEVLPNQNDPNAVIKDSDFVMPPRPKGAVEIIDTGDTGGIIAQSLPRYFTRKLKPDTTLPWISFATYQPPAVTAITKTFDVSCTYGQQTEIVTMSQTIYFSYEEVMSHLSVISSQRRI